jgi:hypothetical protein
MKPVPDPRQTISDWRLAQFALPTGRGGQVHLEGIVRTTGATQLEVQLFARTWPIPDLDPEGEWKLLCEQGKDFIIIHGRPHHLDHPRHILLDIQSRQSRRQTRRHLRVDTEIYLACQRSEAPHPSAQNPLRTKVNLSSQGIGFHTGLDLRPRDLVDLAIILPGVTLESIRCRGRVLRMGAKTEKGRKAALEICDILPEDTEKIVLFCMAEQFRNMRDKTHMLAMLLNEN